jgi:hypothetical protein
MNYTTSDSGFRSMCENQVSHLQGVVPLYTGIGHWRISDEQAIGQVEISRSSGSDGFILFNMGTAHWESEVCPSSDGRSPRRLPCCLTTHR